MWDRMNRIFSGFTRCILCILKKILLILSNMIDRFQARFDESSQLFVVHAQSRDMTALPEG